MVTPDRKSRRRDVLEIHRSSRLVPLSAARIRSVVLAVLQEERVAQAELSIAIVNDEEIHRVNREHLAHDFPTDVISFLYASQAEAGDPRVATSRRGEGLAIEGELVISDETALREAPAHGWAAANELELYLIHGLLHLCGYDDLTAAERRVMRRREQAVLQRLGGEGRSKKKRRDG